jgi:hypothetical protein
MEKRLTWSQIMSTVNYTTFNPLACVQIKQQHIQHMVPDGGSYIGLGVWDEPYSTMIFGTLMNKYNLDISTAPYFMALCESGTDEFTNFSAYTSAGNEPFKSRGAIHISGEEEYQEFAEYLGRPDLLTTQSLVRTELAFDAAYFKWEKLDLGSHCPAVTSVGPSDHQIILPPVDHDVIAYLNQVTGKNATAEVVAALYRMADKLLLFKTLSERDNPPNDGSKLKNLFQSWKTGNFEPEQFDPAAVKVVYDDYMNTGVKSTPENEGALSVVSVINEIDEILP